MMILRHRDTWINSITKANLHTALSKIVPSTYAPTPQQEALDPAGCDHVYLAWSEHLRILARNNEKNFPHVFQENMSYGFHRNLYGLKPLAIIVVLIAIGLSAISGWKKYTPTQEVPGLEASCLGAFVLVLLFWIFLVTKASVKRASYNYASRLLDDCVPGLPAKKSSSPRKPKDAPTA